jgi:putative transposase
LRDRLVRRTLKFRAYPTVSQGGRAVGLLRDHCDLYNAALEERRDAWRKCGVRVGYNDQSAQLREIRRSDPDGQGRHSFTAQQQTLRRLDATFGAFFRRANTRRRKVGYPRFKPYQRFNQVRFVAGDGARWMPVDTGRWAHARFQAVGQLKVRQHRPVAGRVKTLQLQREGRRWYVVVVADVEAEPLPYDVLALEDLLISGLTASARGTVEEPGRNVAQKARRNRSILDAAWGQFTRILVAKAESAGRRVVLVVPSCTSLDCHACGARCTRPRQDIVVCPHCGEHDADRNGACNIATRAGLGSGQALVA